MEFMPRYKEFLQGKSQILDKAHPLAAIGEYKDEITILFSEYELSFEEFPVFFQKVAMGLATAIQAEAAKDNGMFEFLIQISNISHEEMELIIENKHELKELLEVE